MRPELQGIVEEAARLLHAPITLEDRAFDLVAYGSQRPDVDAVRQGSILQRRSSRAVRDWFEQFGIATATGPVITPADAGLGIVARLCLPARWRGVTYGYLWAYDWAGRDVHDPDVVAALGLAEHAGSYLAATSRRRENAAGTLTDLLGVDRDEVERAVATLTGEGLVRAGTPVAVVVAGTAEPGGELSLNLWRLPRAVLAATTDVGTTLLVPLGIDGDLRPAHDAAAQTLDLYAERVPDAARGDLVAGIGAPRTDLRAARSSWREARLALRVAAAVPGRRPVATWDDLGVHRLLAADPAPGLLLDAPVRALLAEPELTRTARVFLDRAGNVAATAAELAVHRQTLYHRLGRIEALTGMSFKDGQDRLRLHLALTLAPVLE